VLGALSLSGSKQVAVDYVKATVYYAGTVDSVVPFPAVAYTFGDIIAQVAKNGPAPSSSTGDLFEDQLVVNDVSNPALIRWSYPGDPEAFPATYYLDFETRQNDRVTNIKVVNGRLIIMLDPAKETPRSIGARQSRPYQGPTAVSTRCARLRSCKTVGQKDSPSSATWVFMLRMDTI